MSELRGRNGKAQNGRVVGTGVALYGYKYARDENNIVMGLEIHEVEASIVRLIYQWYVYGDDKGVRLTTGAIRDRLIEMRVPISGESRRHYRLRQPHLWSKRAVLMVLASETYCGVWRFGKVIGKSGVNGKRPVHEQIAVNVPAIINRDIWQRAQEQRSYNSLMSKRHAKRNYLLRGMLKCGCGAALCGHFRFRRYYDCTWRINHSRVEEKRPCGGKWINAENLENFVWNYATELFSNKVEFERLLRQAQRSEKKMLAPKREELETVEKLLEACDREAEEYAQALVKARGAVGNALEAKVNEVNARHDALTKRREKLTDEIQTQRLTDDAVNELMQFREDVVTGMRALTYEDKRNALEKLRTQIQVTNGREVVVTFLMKVVRRGIIGEQIS